MDIPFKISGNKLLMILKKERKVKQSDIREEHLRNVYEYVLHHSRVSRAKIARELELSRPSSSSLVDELIFMELFMKMERKKWTRV